MVQRADGRKKSEFVAVTEIPDGAYVDVFLSGTNRKILVTDFARSLGIQLGTPRLNESQYATTSMQGNSTNTVIATQSVAVAVAGTFASVEAEGFTATATSRLTYDGTETMMFRVDGSVSMQTVTGGQLELSLQIAKNGTVIPSTRMTSSLPSASHGVIATCPLIELDLGDYLELFVANEDSSVDIEVYSAILRVC